MKVWHRDHIGDARRAEMRRQVGQPFLVDRQTLAVAGANGGADDQVARLQAGVERAGDSEADQTIGTAGDQVGDAVPRRMGIAAGRDRQRPGTEDPRLAGHAGDDADGHD